MFIIHRKKVVIAPDSFKESMTALEVADAVEAGFQKVFSDWEYVKVPMADGGEGTVQSLVDATNGSIKKVEALDPLGRKIEAFYGISGDGKQAVIEMAAASGLELLKSDERDAMSTTSWGLGDLIRAALDEEVERILIGIGGSATNDAGAGMLQSLGGKLLDASGQQIPYGGVGLKGLDKMDVSELDPRLKDIVIEVACDVTNPLTGTDGASYVYGPQKGASEEQVEELDRYLKHFAKVVRRDLDVDIEDEPGAGAAGGIGGALLAFFNAKLRRGGELITEMLALEDTIKDADLAITGEGGINHQTIFGKTPIVVAKIAKKYDIPVIALVGSISEGHEEVYEHGIDAVFSIISEVADLEETLEAGIQNVEMTARNVAATLKLNI
ncbi:glycerate kinase [Carnobacteriaceae bacterium 52-44]